MISSIILAAGTSSRMGKPKLELILGNMTLLEHTLSKFLNANVDEVILVLHPSQSIPESIKSGKVRIVFNPAYRQGMSTSLKAGLAAVKKESIAVIIGLGDQPLVSTATINALIDAYLRTKAMIILPTYMGKRGNPVLFDTKMLPEIMRVSGDEGARSVLEKHSKLIHELEVDDEGVVIDIDTMEDYLRIKQLYFQE